MITIGQLARHVGVSVKTIRVYHAKGLLPEPPRDSSGYRRYTAKHAIELIKIRILAESGVPLARIRELMGVPEDELRQALARIDSDLSGRIRNLQATQRRLRRLASGHEQGLPPDVAAYLRTLTEFGFSKRWIELQGELWLLVFATDPITASRLLKDQARALADRKLRQIFLDYDRARDLDPDDPRIDRLARRIVAATRERYGSAELPGQDAASPIPALIQGSVNAMSPAWERLDLLIREQLRSRTPAGSTRPSPK